VSIALSGGALCPGAFLQVGLHVEIDDLPPAAFHIDRYHLARRAE